MLLHRDARESAHVIEFTLFDLDADRRVLERLPDGGERLTREFVGGRILKRLLLTADGVETEGELGADLAIDVDLVAVGALARLLHQQRAEIPH